MGYAALEFCENSMVKSNSFWLDIKESGCLISNRATSEYVRYVFSVVPGAGSILGFFAVIAFLPATVKCRKVGEWKHIKKNRGRQARKLFHKIP